MDNTGAIRRAIVLGGGGSKGSYEVGVWQALDELGIAYHVVTGTSVGALNGALMAMGKLPEALEMWSNLDNTQVMTDIPAITGEASALREVYRAFVNQMLRSGGVDISPLEQRIRALLDEDKLRHGSIQLGVVTVEYPSLKPVEWLLHEIPDGRLADYLLASAACFPAFHPKEIDGSAFIDGGYANNIPIDLALRAQPPVDEVIAVDIEGIGIVRPVPDSVPVTRLRCYWSLGSILIFDQSQCRRNIRLGYLDGMKTFGGYGGRAYTFDVGEAEQLETRHLVAVSRCCLAVVDTVSGEGKRELGSMVAGRIMGAATHRRTTSPDSIDLHELLLASGELAAELLGLDPTTLYTADSFDAAILVGIGKLTADTAGIINALGRNKTPNLARLMSRWRKEHLLAICAFLLHRNMGGDTSVPPQLIATLMPREFLASLYIEALLY